MVVQIFVAQRETVDSLAQEFENGVFNLVRVTMISEAVRLAPRQREPIIQLTQQQRSASIATQVTSFEVYRHFSTFMALKLKFLLPTLCHCEVGLSVAF